MKKIAALLFSILILSAVSAESVKPSLDGRAVVANIGVLPVGFYAKSPGFLPGDTVIVTNPNSNISLEVMVFGTIDPSEGVAILLSPEAARELRINRGSSTIVKVTKKTSGYVEQSILLSSKIEAYSPETDADVNPVLNIDDPVFEKPTIVVEEPIFYVEEPLLPIEEILAEGPEEETAETEESEEPVEELETEELPGAEIDSETDSVENNPVTETADSVEPETADEIDELPSDDEPALSEMTDNVIPEKVVSTENDSEETEITESTETEISVTEEPETDDSGSEDYPYDLISQYVEALLAKSEEKLAEFEETEKTEEEGDFASTEVPYDLNPVVEETVDFDGDETDEAELLEREGNVWEEKLPEETESSTDSEDSVLYENTESETDEILEEDFDEEYDFLGSEEETGLEPEVEEPYYEEENFLPVPETLSEPETVIEPEAAKEPEKSGISLYKDDLVDWLKGIIKQEKEAEAKAAADAEAAELERIASEKAATEAAEAERIALEESADAAEIIEEAEEIVTEDIETEETDLESAETVSEESDGEEEILEEDSETEDFFVEDEEIEAEESAVPEDEETPVEEEEILTEENVPEEGDESLDSDAEKEEVIPEESAQDYDAVVPESEKIAEDEELIEENSETVEAVTEESEEIAEETVSEETVEEKTAEPVEESSAETEVSLVPAGLKPPVASDDYVSYEGFYDEPEVMIIPVFSGSDYSDDADIEYQENIRDLLTELGITGKEPVEEEPYEEESESAAELVAVEKSEEKEPEPVVESVPETEGTSVPTVKRDDLAKGYYIQILTVSKAENAKETLDKFGAKYPVVLVETDSGLVQVMIGSLRADEYPILLERFRMYGFKDAFLRTIK